MNNENILRQEIALLLASRIINEDNFRETCELTKKHSILKAIREGIDVSDCYEFYCSLKINDETLFQISWGIEELNGNCSDEVYYGFEIDYPLSRQLFKLSYAEKADFMALILKLIIEVNLSNSPCIQFTDSRREATIFDALRPKYFPLSQGFHCFEYPTRDKESTIRHVMYIK